MSAVLALARPEIRDLPAYAHAQWRAHFTRLHANEVPWRPAGDRTRAGLNRYPEPQPRALIERLAALYGVATDEVLVTHGSDESIDVLSRTFLRAGADAILQMAPTFAMYRHAARIQGARVIEVPLRSHDWGLDVERVIDAGRDEAKLVYLCSPNNPTGNAFDRGALEAVIQALDGRALIVLDEAYVEWSRESSLVPWLERYETLVILRTLSKAHALAGARVGALLGRPEVIELLRRVVPPYSLAQPSIEAALRALAPHEMEAAQARVQGLITEREWLHQELTRCGLVRRVWPSDANFLLVECREAECVLERALEGGCLVRDQRSWPCLSQAVRISVGSRQENTRLLESLGVAAAGPAAGARCALQERRTQETAVRAAVAVEGGGRTAIDTGIGFFDHMLEQLAKHGGFALELHCRGDLRVDEHHTVEDCALTLGAALREALKDKRGIARYGFVLPMDEAQAQIALDLSGRSYFIWEGTFGRERVGDLPTELVPHFFRSLADALGATLHIQVRGENCHHMIEACFKGVGRSLRQAIRLEGTELPSTKGVL